MRTFLIVPLTALLIGCGSDSKTDTGAGAGAGTTGTTPAAAPATDGETVEIADFKFGPALTIAAGTAVTWKNADGAPHNAVGDEFKTADLEKGESDTVTFDEAGTFDYICTFHPFMKGSVVVR